MKYCRYQGILPIRRLKLLIENLLSSKFFLYCCFTIDFFFFWGGGLRVVSDLFLLMGSASFRFQSLSLFPYCSYLLAESGFIDQLFTILLDWICCRVSARIPWLSEKFGISTWKLIYKQCNLSCFWIDSMSMSWNFILSMWIAWIILWVWCTCFVCGLSGVLRELLCSHLCCTYILMLSSKTGLVDADHQFD